MNRLTGILGAALLALGIVAAVLWRETTAARTHNQQLMARVAALESARGGSVASPAAAPAGLPSAADAADQVQSAATPGTPPARDDQQRRTGVRQLMDTAEGREYTRLMARLSMEQRFPDIAEALGISQEQADQLLDLLARRTIDLGAEAMDLRASLAPEGATGEQMARLLAERQQAFEGELSSLLGADYPRWKEYEQTSATRQQERAVRQQREQLRNAVSTRSNPLSDSQLESFAAAIDAEQKRFDRESRAQPMQQQVQRFPERNRRLLEVAATHLDAVQLERYRRHLEQQTQLMRSLADMAGPAPTP